MELKSKFKIEYLDDLSLGGITDSLVADVDFMQAKSKEMGIFLNASKCEIISCTDSALNTDSFNHSVLADFVQIMPTDAILLGAPILNGDSMNRLLDKRIEDFVRATDKLVQISRHDALIILKNCLSAPKLLYTLRTSPCYNQKQLPEIDNQFRICLVE